MASTMLWFKLARSDPLALHDQVAAEIRRAIAEGEAGPGERLPLAKDLAALLEQRAIQGESPDPEALFREARRRRHRRWLISGLVSVVALGTAILLIVTRDGRVAGINPSPKPLHPPPGHTAQAPASNEATAWLHGPEALAVASNGGVLIDEDSSQIVEREPSGRFKLIAGDGHVGFSGDGGPATDAELHYPVAIAVAPSGTIYVADVGNNRIRAIHPNGMIATVATVSQPGALAVGPNGTVYFIDGVGIQALGADGRITTIVSPQEQPGIDGGAVHVSTDGGQFVAWNPDAIAVSSSGDVYVANFSPKAVLRFSASGSPPTLVRLTDVSTESTYVTPSALAAASNGSIILANYGEFGIDRAIGTSIQVVKGFTRGSVPELPGIFRPSGVAVAPNGEIFTDTDGRNGGTNTPALLAIDRDGLVHILAVGSPVPRTGS